MGVPLRGRVIYGKRAWMGYRSCQAIIFDTSGKGPDGDGDCDEGAIRAEADSDGMGWKGDEIWMRAGCLL